MSTSLKYKVKMKSEKHNRRQCQIEILSVEKKVKRGKLKVKSEYLNMKHQRLDVKRKI